MSKKPEKRDYPVTRKSDTVVGKQSGVIPGRRGKSINEGPGTWIPPMRSTDPPREVDRDADSHRKVG